MMNPAFFTENQSGVNPHNQLSYKQSAQIVINHVTDGMKLADKYNLPKVIKDFICTHHGRGLTKYFISPIRMSILEKKLTKKHSAIPVRIPLRKNRPF